MNSKRELQKESTRAGLLKASLELFAEFSFNGTSMEMIAHKAGVSKGLAYSHFNSKNELLLELIRFYWEAKRLGYIEILESNMEPKEKFEKLVDHALSFTKGNKEEAEQMRLLHSIVLQPGNLEIIMPYIESLKLEFFGSYELLDQLFRELGVKNPVFERHFFRTMIQGIMMMFLIEEKDYPLNELKELILKRYIK